MTRPDPDTSKTLRDKVRELYTGQSRTSIRFRYGLVAFDFMTIVFFIVTAAIPVTPALTLMSRLVGLVILADFCARLWISQDRKALMKRVYMLADVVVIVSLFIDPLFAHNLGFLRILRGLRLVHAYELLSDLRRESRFFRRHEEAIVAASNLFVFMFFMSSAVYSLHFSDTSTPENYLDALYFTVTTLTTTGYGDITLPGTGGKLLSVVIMVVGVALFVQLARTVFQPSKVRHTCESCGLRRHEIDAIHCKHCGVQLRIETDGVD